MNYARLTELGNKIRHNTASKAEKDEYMLILYQNGDITEKQYNDYISGRNTESLVNVGLAAGAILLAGYLLSQLFSKKD